MKALLRAYFPEFIALVSLALFDACVFAWASIIGGLPQ